jgi:amino acid transporter
MAIGPNDKSYEFTDDSASNPQNGSFSPFDDKFNSAPQRPTRVRRFLDSFKPDSNAQMTFAAPREESDGGNKGYDVEAAAAATAMSPLARKLKGRHLQMIAIGGSVGTF